MPSSNHSRPKSRHKAHPPSFQFPRDPPPGLLPSKEDIVPLLAVVAIAIAVGTACHYMVTRFNRPSTPFCDSHESSEASLSVSIVDFCEPCPDNGVCSGGKWECVHGYTKHGKLCIEDREIIRTAKDLSERVEHLICEAYAQFLCYGTGATWFQEDEILKALDEFKLMLNGGLKNDSVMFMKQKAMETIQNSLETKTSLDGIKEFKCPDWLAEHYKPILCSVRQWVVKHVLFLLVASGLLLGSVRFFWRIHWNGKLSVRAEQLYEQVCEILEENAMTVKSKGEGESWVVASRLRDHLLLPKERRDTFLWKKVEELVQEDSRLDRYPKLIKGESRTVWEWQVEGSLHSRMRTKGSSNKTKSVEHIYKSSPEQQRKLQPSELSN